MLARTARAAVAFAAFALAASAAPRGAVAAELALARGTIALGAQPEARCEELVVEARDALDAHVIALARPALEDGECRYAVSVPAQTAVELSVHTVALLAPVNLARLAPLEVRARGGRTASASVAIRFTLVAASTYFFAPGEDKIVPLAYTAPGRAPV